jgi:hypothetical protein
VSVLIRQIRPRKNHAVPIHDEDLLFH